MSKEKWQSLTRTELQELAQKKGVAGASRMTKPALLAALAKLDRAKTKVKEKIVPRAQKQASRQAAAARRHLPWQWRRHRRGNRRTQQVRRRRAHQGSLRQGPPRICPRGYGKDRIVCMVRDPYWLHCYWELTRKGIQRAEAAFGQDWHGAKPILRLLDVSTQRHHRTSESIVRDIDIHGGVQQLVHRRRQSAPLLPHRHRLSVHAAANSTSWPAPTSSPRPGPA